MRGNFDAQLARLPPELLTRICTFCTTRSISNLAATNTVVRRVAISDDLWRPRCLALWRKHAIVPGEPTSDNYYLARRHTPGEEQLLFSRFKQGTFWCLWYRLLGPYGALLGWHAAADITSRDTYVRFVLQEDRRSLEPFEGVIIVATTVLIKDAFASNDQDVRSLIPSNAMVHVNGIYTCVEWEDCPRNGLSYPGHPDSAKVVFLFRPTISFRPLFTINAAKGIRIRVHDALTPLPMTLHYSFELPHIKHHTVMAPASIADRRRVGLPSGHLLEMGGLRYSDVEDESDLTCMCPGDWRGASVRQLHGSGPSFDFTIGCLRFETLASSYSVVIQPRWHPTLPAHGRIVRRHCAMDLHHDENDGQSSFQQANLRFIPIHNPQTLTPPCIWHSERSDLLHPSSLEGLYAAGYGPGIPIEIVFIRFDAMTGGLSALELSGDHEVPSGDIRWHIQLVDTHVPTTTNEELLRLTEGPDADLVALAKAGAHRATLQRTLEDSHSPDWYAAQAIFIRSNRGGKQVVDEIRLREENIICFSRILPDQ